MKYSINISSYCFIYMCVGDGGRVRANNFFFRFQPKENEIVSSSELKFIGHNICVIGLNFFFFLVHFVTNFSCGYPRTLFHFFEKKGRIEKRSKKKNGWTASRYARGLAAIKRKCHHQSIIIVKLFARLNVYISSSS